MFKNAKKVSFNTASEASDVYILSGQKLIKNAKNGQLGELNSVARQVNFKRWKMAKFATFWVIFKLFIHYSSSINSQMR